jgi:transcriptional regulator of arginine metabolism
MKLEFIIKNLIQNNKIKTQSELGQILKKKGFDTTQSNISRILKKINTVKLIDENKDVYYIVRSKPLDIAGWIKNLIISIDANDREIVIKTYPGAADLIKRIVEERNIDNAMAVLSSGNVVAVIISETKYVDEVLSRLKMLFLVGEK